MEIDRQIEIFKLAKENLKSTDIIGICKTFDNLLISMDISLSEYYLIKQILADNKPTAKNQFKEFTQNNLWYKNDYPVYNGFWWKIDIANSECKEMRLKYLDALINNLK